MNSLFRKETLYLVVIAVVLFVFVDLLLGQFFPKVYAPTKYGWTISANTRNTGWVEDTKGMNRQVFSEYFEYGFKRWPVSSTSKSRVLIIGDSYTEMTQVSNGEEWYSYLERGSPEISFYVFGGRGYGTLQELMVLKDRIDEIRPDVIIWQFCGNDYENNSYLLDRLGYPFNTNRARPYFENGKIIYRLPLPFASLRRMSFAADQLLHRYDSYAFAKATQDLKLFAEKRQGENNSQLIKEIDIEMIRALQVTKDLMRMVRATVGEIIVHFFNACGAFTANDKAVCDAGGFNCIDFVGDYVEKLRLSGRQVSVENDRHWNYLGNKLVGEALAEYFKQKEN